VFFSASMVLRMVTRGRQVERHLISCGLHA
jgi:hypothetical protein